MSLKNVQFAVAAHIATVLGTHYGEGVTSDFIAASVNADVTFVRRSISKLAKAGIIKTARGKNGSCTLARPPEEINLLDVYKASEAPGTFSLHNYEAFESCAVSVNFGQSMSEVLGDAQEGFEARLAARSLASLVARIQKLDNNSCKKALAA
jgi:DNA-binding IscR family transcriptional regulator